MLIVLILASFILAGMLPQGLIWLKIKRWQSRLAIKEHLVIYNQLFCHVNGFALSKKARAKLDAFEYLYGEIEFTSFIALLALANPDKETVFYDLGSV
jgi:hypothetical protein